MENFSKRRIDVATCWANNRIAVLDSLEKYEESFAIAEEFREWITNMAQPQETLSKHVLNLPKDISLYLNKQIKFLSSWIF